MSKTTHKRNAKRLRMRRAQGRAVQRNRASRRQRGDLFRFILEPRLIHGVPVEAPDIPNGSLVEYLRPLSRNRASVRFGNRHVTVHRDHLRSVPSGPCPLPPVPCPSASGPTASAGVRHA